MTSKGEYTCYLFNTNYLYSGMAPIYIMDTRDLLRSFLPPYHSLIIPAFHVVNLQRWWNYLFMNEKSFSTD